MRLDIVVSKIYWHSRNKAQSFIENGLVSVNANICNKVSYQVLDSDKIILLETPETHWVSRSAGKLDGFLREVWVQQLNNKVALDIGSSTWGFTQILLLYWIQHVDAVDVGTNQLHESIRWDSRVSSYENTDIREYSSHWFYDIITIDVSFISLCEIVPVLPRFMKPETDIYMLYKPQFEVGRNNLRKTWVPRDEGVVNRFLSDFVKYLATSWFVVKKVSQSSVIGEAGNQEYMLHVVRELDSRA